MEQVFLSFSKSSTLLILAFFANFNCFAQSNTGNLTKRQTWQLMDYKQDTVYGASVNRAYKELLAGKKSRPIIVAVIDEGVDISHEDLQGHIWNNKKEIPGNGIDDDKNGYVDDIHGWNFLGGKEGRNIYATNSEADREYARLLPEFAGKDAVKAAQLKDYSYFQKVKKEHITDSIGRNRRGYPLLAGMIHNLQTNDSIVKAAAHKNELNFLAVTAFEPKDSLSSAAKKGLLAFYTGANAEGKAMPLNSLIALVKTRMAGIKVEDSLYAQVKTDPLILRKEIVGDNPFDINNKLYGNNKVGDQFAGHGTHCSGIISAIRNNGIGIDGVADNVIIMPVRAVNTLHYGDEMDKDIALAIRYAVDNGAQIISMSFGKDLSPQKQWVDEAIKYADKKGVLIVHAAGNDHMDIDTAANFPSAYYLNSTAKAENFINVGSISIDTGYALTAKDSNYGQLRVDLFAPGVGIYSSVPGDKYQFMSGTSMATPVVAGVAALIMEYYPKLTAKQVKDILLNSVTPLKGKIVYRPGSRTKVDFAALCVSGGVVNAYQALKMAEKMSSD